MNSPCGKGVREQHISIVRHAISMKRGDFAMACLRFRSPVAVLIDLNAVKYHFLKSNTAYALIGTFGMPLSPALNNVDKVSCLRTLHWWSLGLNLLTRS